MAKEIGECIASEIDRLGADLAAERTRREAAEESCNGLRLVIDAAFVASSVGNVRAVIAASLGEYRDRVPAFALPPAGDLAAERTRREDAELALRVRDATIAMAVDRLEGVVEGRPTHRGNFLQRIDELRDIERRAISAIDIDAEADWIVFWLAKPMSHAERVAFVRRALARISGRTMPVEAGDREAAIRIVDALCPREANRDHESIEERAGDLIMDAQDRGSFDEDEDYLSIARVEFVSTVVAALPSRAPADAREAIAALLCGRLDGSGDSWEDLSASRRGAWLEMADDVLAAIPPRVPAVIVEEHRKTLAELRACAKAWDPAVCLLGNVRAGDIVAAIDAIAAVLPARYPASAPAADARVPAVIVEGNKVETYNRIRKILCFDPYSRADNRAINEIIAVVLDAASHAAPAAEKEAGGGRV